jgi:hypothetical protein
MSASEGRSTPIGPVLAILGGALLAIGSFLSWAEVSGGGVSVSAKGIDGTDGWVTLVAGLIAIVAGIAAMRGGRRALAVLAIVAGLVGGGLGLYDALTAEDSVLDAAAEEIATQVGASVEEVRVLLDQAIESGEFGISLSIGLYLVIGGGLIAIVGGILQMAGGRAPVPSLAANAPSSFEPAAPAPAAPASEDRPMAAPPAPPAPPPDTPS